MPFLVYRSSAGSGKTFTLVKEYLVLVLSRPDEFRNILAITFTNKATSEMKSRIMVTLNYLAYFPESKKAMEMRVELLREESLVNVDIRQRAQDVLTRILHHYSEFNVSTIDSFVHRIVRSFAFDLNLPGNFLVSLDKETLIDDALSLMLDNLKDGEKLTGLLVCFIEKKVEQEERYGIYSSLKNTGSVLFNEHEYEKALTLQSITIDDFQLIIKKLYLLRQRFESQLKEYGERFAFISKRYGLLEEHAPYKSSSYFGYFSRLARGDFKTIRPGTRVSDQFLNGKWFSAKVALPQQDELADQLTQLSNDLLQVVERHANAYDICGLVLDQIFETAVLAHISTAIQRISKEKNQVHLSEFNRKISSVVLNEPVPFVYSRVGVKFRHFLLDEFQDTSLIQWQNLLPLVHNALSTAEFGKPSTCLVVGDEKQSIYRWRGGEVEQFHALPNVYKRPDLPWFDEAESQLGDAYLAKALTVNYRSLSSIVDFNNNLFRSIVNSLSDEKISGFYNDLEQQTPKGREGGYIRVEVTTSEDSNVSELRQQATDKAVEAIKVMLESGWQANRIAVLCRTNSECSMISAGLYESSIPVMSTESLLVSSSQEVSCIVSALSLLAYPTEELYKASYLILKSIIHTVESKNPDDSQLESLSLFCYTHLGRYPDEYYSLPLYDLVEQLIRDIIPLSAYNVYLQFFLDAVLEYQKGDNEGIAGFLTWWEKASMTKSVYVPDGADAVQVMTIHKAKGLDFDVVVMPYLLAQRKSGMKSAYDWINPGFPEVEELQTARVKLKDGMPEPIQSLYLEESNKSLLDDLNLLYVALTRACKRIVLFVSSTDSTSSSKGMAELLRIGLLDAFEFSEVNGVFEFGEDNLYLIDRIELVEPISAMTPTMQPGWHDRVVIGRPSIVRSAEKASKAVEEGLMIHDLFASVIHADDFEVVLMREFNRGLITQDQAAHFRSLFAEMMGNHDIALLFENQDRILTEATLLLPDGVRLRPDRVIFNDEKAIVVDYKSGEPHDEHHEQVRKYKDALKRTGIPEVDGYLLYLSGSPILVEVI